MVRLNIHPVRLQIPPRQQNLWNSQWREEQQNLKPDAAQKLLLEDVTPDFQILYCPQEMGGYKRREIKSDLL